MTSNEDFIKDWMEGKISPEELENRRAQNDQTVKRFEKIIATSARLKVPDTQTKEQAWQKLSRKINSQPTHQTKVIEMSRWIPLSAAASLTFVVVCYFLFFAKTTVSTSMAENLNYVLPDGSEVVLNADSKISFKQMFWTNDRTVMLDGEAFFKVKKGSTFTVISSSVTITVLGTSFNVNTRPKTVEISCFTGKVKVNSQENEVILSKGEFTNIEDDSLIRPLRFDEKMKATWRNGEFYFDSKPIGLIIDELQRQFDVTIEYHGDDSRLYTGYFNTKNLDDALTMVFKPMSLTYYKKSNKKIIVE
jgi:transmembrane sensor